MKRTLNQAKTRTKSQNFALQIRTSEYSRLYAAYLKTEYHNVQLFIRQFVKLPFCNHFYLKYPLEGVLKGISKKLLLNIYEFTVFGYFLSQVEWRLDHCIYMNLAEVFPNIIHVNEPTDTNTLKQLSMFLYFSSYSVKEFLNEDIQTVKQEMIKIFPEFQHLQAYWTSTQPTVGQVLNPKALNSFYKSVSKINKLVDFNTCVDRILQISPCYDITARNQKPKELPTFGYMMTGAINYNNDLQNNVEINLKIQDNLQDYQFDGDI